MAAEWYGPEYILPGIGAGSDYRKPIADNGPMAFATAREGFYHGGNSIVFDTETTNRNPEMASPLEIYATELDAMGRPTGRDFHRYVHPAEPLNMSDAETVQAILTHGIVENRQQRNIVEQYARANHLPTPNEWTYLDEVKALTPQQAAAHFGKFVDDVKPSVVMANNSQYDLKVLNNMDPAVAQRVASLPQFDFQAGWRARGAIDPSFRPTRGNGAVSYSQAAMHNLLKLPGQQSHRAKADVLQSVEITRRVLDRNLPAIMMPQSIGGKIVSRIPYAEARQYVRQVISGQGGRVRGPEAGPFNAALRARAIDLRARQDMRAGENSGRVYQMGNRYLPSVTTFLHSPYTGTSSNRWAPTMGTLTHELIEQAMKTGRPVPKLTGGSYNMLGIASKSASAWVNHVANNHPDWQLVGSEIPVVHPELGYAGTIDAIYRDAQGQHHLIDYKTNKELDASKLDYYTRQLAAYSMPGVKMVGADGQLSDLPHISSAQIAHLNRNTKGAGVTVGMYDRTSHMAGAQGAVQAEWQQYAAGGQLQELLNAVSSGSVDIKQLSGSQLQLGPPVGQQFGSRSSSSRPTIMPAQGEVPNDLKGADRRLRNQNKNWESILEEEGLGVIDPEARRRANESRPEIPMQHDDLLAHAHPDRNPSNYVMNSVVGGGNGLPILFPGDQLQWESYDTGKWFPAETQTYGTGFHPMYDLKDPRTTKDTGYRVGKVVRGSLGKALYSKLVADNLKRDPSVFRSMGDDFEHLGFGAREKAQSQLDAARSGAGFPNVAIPMMPAGQIQQAFNAVGESDDLYREVSSRVEGALKKVGRSAILAGGGTMPRTRVDELNSALEQIGFGRNAHGLLPVLDVARQMGTVTAAGVAQIMPRSRHIDRNTIDTVLQQAAALGYGNYDTKGRSFTGNDSLSHLFANRLAPNQFYSMVGSIPESERQSATLQRSLNNPLLQFRTLASRASATDPVQQVLEAAAGSVGPTAPTQSMSGRPGTDEMSLLDYIGAASPGGPLHQGLLNENMRKHWPTISSQRSAFARGALGILNSQNGTQLRKILGHPDAIPSEEILYSKMANLTPQQRAALNAVKIQDRAVSGTRVPGFAAFGFRGNAAGLEQQLWQLYGAQPAQPLPGGGGGSSMPPPPPPPPRSGGYEEPEEEGDFTPPRGGMPPISNALWRLAERAGYVKKYGPVGRKAANIEGWDYENERPSEKLGRPVPYGYDAGGKPLKTTSLSTLRTKAADKADAWEAALTQERHRQKQLMEGYEQVVDNYPTISPSGRKLDVANTGWVRPNVVENGYARAYLGGQYIPPSAGAVLDKYSTPMAAARVRAALAAQARGASPIQASELTAHLLSSSYGAGQARYDQAIGMGLPAEQAEALAQKARVEELTKQQKDMGFDAQPTGARGHLQSVLAAHGSNSLTDFMARRALLSASWGVSGMAVYKTAEEARRAWEESLYIQRAQVSLANITPPNLVSPMLHGISNLATNYGVRPEEAYNVAFKMQGYFGNGPGASSKNQKGVDDTLKATTATLLLAKTATIELSEAMGDLVAITDSFGGGANGMMKTVDGLVGLQKQWGINIEQTVAGLSRLANLFNQFNIKEPLGAAIVSRVVQGTGESGVQVASKLERVLPNINDPTVQGQVTELGVKYGLFDRKAMLGGGGVDLNMILNAVGGAYSRGDINKGAVNRFSIALGGNRGDKELIDALTHWGDVKSRQAVFATSHGEAQDRWNALSKTAIERLKEFEAAFHSLAVSIASSGVLSMFSAMVLVLTKVAQYGNAIIGVFNGITNAMGVFGAATKAVIGALVAAAVADKVMSSSRLVKDIPLIGSYYGNRSVQGIPLAGLTLSDARRMASKNGGVSLAEDAYFVPGRTNDERLSNLAAYRAYTAQQEAVKSARAGLGLEETGVAASTLLGPNGSPIKSAGLAENTATRGGAALAGVREFGGGFVKGAMAPLMMMSSMFSSVMKTMIEWGGKFALRLREWTKIIMASELMGSLGGKLGMGEGGLLKGLAGKAAGALGLGEAGALGAAGAVAGLAGAAIVAFKGIQAIMHNDAKMAIARQQDQSTYMNSVSQLQQQYPGLNITGTGDNRGLGSRIDLLQQARDNAVKHRGFFGKLWTGTVGFFNTGAENSMINTAVPGKNVGELDGILKNLRADQKAQLEQMYQNASKRKLNWLAPEDLDFRAQDVANQVAIGGPSYVMKGIFGNQDPTKIGFNMTASKQTTSLDVIKNYSADLQQTQAQINYALEQGQVSAVKQLRQHYMETLKNMKDLIDAQEQASASLKGFFESSGDAQRDLVKFYDDQLARNPNWDKNSPQYLQNRLAAAQAQAAALQADTQNQQGALTTLQGFDTSPASSISSYLAQAQAAAALVQNLKNAGMKGSQTYIDALNQAGQAYNTYIDQLYQNIVSQQNAHYAVLEAGTRDPLQIAKLKYQQASANYRAILARDNMRNQAQAGKTGDPVIDSILKDLKDVATAGKTSGDTFKTDVKMATDSFSSGVHGMTSHFNQTMNRWLDVANHLLNQGTRGGGPGGGHNSSHRPHSWQQLRVSKSSDTNYKQDLAKLRSGKPPSTLTLETSPGNFSTFDLKEHHEVSGRGTVGAATPITIKTGGKQGQYFEYTKPGDKGHYFYVNAQTGAVFESSHDYHNNKGTVTTGKDWHSYQVPTAPYNAGSMPHAPGGHWETHYDPNTGRKRQVWVPDATPNGKHPLNGIAPWHGTMSQFMHGLRTVESGNNYAWKSNGYGQGYWGAYQIGTSEWKSWAKGAGVNPNDHSRHAQDTVARWRLGQLNREYHGDWRKVAAAWYSGEGGEQKWASTGWQGGTNPTISSYVDKVLQNAGSAFAQQGGPRMGTGLRNRIVQYGLRYLGVPYKWGGKDPNGFDCSGLVSWVYQKFGIDESGNAANEVAQADKIKASQARRGDIVYYNEGTNKPQHIGIYLGNGKMLDSPHTGANVRVEDVWAGAHYARPAGLSGSGGGGGGSSADAQQAQAAKIAAKLDVIYAKVEEDIAMFTYMGGAVSQPNQIEAQIKGLREKARADKKYNMAGWFQDMVQLEQQLYALAQQRIDSWKLGLELSGDDSNRAQTLGIEAKGLQRQMAAYLKHGGSKSDAEYKQMKLQRKDDLRDQALQKVQYQEQTYDYMYETHQMGWQSYLEHLQKLAKTVNTTTQAGKELYRQITGQIQSMIDALAGQFNLPDVGALAPTVYQARRAVANGGIVGGITNAPIPYKAAGFATGTDSFGGGMAMVGENGPELISMPSGSSVVTNANVHSLISSMSTMATSFNRMHTTHSVANAGSNAQMRELVSALKDMKCEQQVHIQVNGADILEVKKLLNNMFGPQSTGRVSFASRR